MNIINSGGTFSKLTRLGDLIDFRNDIVHPRDNPAGAAVFVGLEHIERETGIRIGQDKVELSELTGRRARFYAGDIVYGYLRPYLNKVWIAEFDGICSVDQYVFIARENVDRNYLAHFLRSEQFLQTAPVGSTPGQLPRIRSGEIADTPIALPALVEQRRIAAILDNADSLRRKRKRTLDLLDSLRQAIFLEMFGSLSSNSNAWSSANITDACELIVDCVNRTAPVVDYPTPYKMLRTTNVRNGRVDVDNVRFVTKETFDRWNRRNVPRSGDVLLTREAPVGGVGMLETDDQVFLGQRLMLYRPKQGVMTSDFLVWSFADKYLRDQYDRMSSGSTVKHLPLPACRAFEVRTPPIALQEQFSERIRLLKKIESSGSHHEVQILKAFSSLQHRAFSGQL